MRVTSAVRGQPARSLDVVTVVSVFSNLFDFNTLKPGFVGLSSRLPVGSNCRELRGSWK